jgi:two-component system, sensor histidine kinase and response regulator
MVPSAATSTILVVDDNADNRALAKETLEDEGYRVLLASSGEEALALIESHAPDCVLLDVRMPGMDGLAVCDRIRKLPARGDTPVVFLTAQRDLETFDRALRAGGDDFLTKPVRPAELVARVQAALKLRRMSNELREHYDLVRKQRDDLMRLQLQKERLMAFVVHDLKNPVNSMDLHAQLLLRNRALPDSARDSVQRIREEARSLLRLLLNLLDISKSEEGQLTPQLGQVDLAALTAEVIEACGVKAQAVGVTLQSSIALKSPVRADADLLRRVLENLIDNALRHAPEHSTVQIRAAARDGMIELCVRDAGCGLPDELKSKVFDRYVQLEHGERVVARTGRGLGLTFCRLAIEAHGGKIWVEDADPGAAFCVRLPE